MKMQPTSRFCLTHATYTVVLTVFLVLVYLGLAFLQVVGQLSIPSSLVHAPAFPS